MKIGRTTRRIVTSAGGSWRTRQLVLPTPQEQAGDPSRPLVCLEPDDTGRAAGTLYRAQGSGQVLRRSGLEWYAGLGQPSSPLPWSVRGVRGPAPGRVCAWPGVLYVKCQSTCAAD